MLDIASTMRDTYTHKDILRMPLDKAIPEYAYYSNLCKIFAKVCYLTRKTSFEKKGQKDPRAIVHQLYYGKLGEFAAYFYLKKFDPSLSLPDLRIYLSESQLKLKDIWNNKINKEIPNNAKNSIFIDYSRSKEFDPDLKGSKLSFHLKTQDEISERTSGISHIIEKKDIALFDTKPNSFFVFNTINIEKKEFYIRYILGSREVRSVLDETLKVLPTKKAIYLYNPATVKASNPHRKNIHDIMSSPRPLSTYYDGNNIKEFSYFSKKKVALKNNEKTVTENNSFKFNKKVPSKTLSYKEGISLLKDYKLIMALGNEPFYRDQVSNKIISLYPNLDIVKIDCEGMDELDIISTLSYKDLFSSNRILILKNFNKIKKLSKIYERDYNDIIILDSSKEGRSKNFKELKKRCLVIDCNKPKSWLQESDACGKIIGFIRSKGLDITRDTATYLYNQIGYDLYKIMGELSKLIVLKKDDSDKEVTTIDIDRICISGINYNIFDLIDKIISGDKKGALLLIDKIFKYESSPGVLLISLWFTHFENLLYIKSNKDKKEIFKYIKMAPATVEKKLIPQAKKLSTNKIIESLNYLIDVDHNLRQGSFDLRYSLDKFILNF